MRLYFNLHWFVLWNELCERKGNPNKQEERYKTACSLKTLWNELDLCKKNQNHCGSRLRTSFSQTSLLVLWSDRMSHTCGIME